MPATSGSLPHPPWRSHRGRRETSHSPISSFQVEKMGRISARATAFRIAKRMLQPLPHPCPSGGNGFQLLCTSTSLTVSAPATHRGSVKSHRDRRFPWSPLLGCRGATIPNSSCWGSRTRGEGSPPSTAKAWTDQAVLETPSHRLPNLPNLSYGGWSRTSTAGTRGSLAHPEPFCAQPGAPGARQEPSTLSQ